MDHFWRVIIPIKPLPGKVLCVHGWPRGQCIKDSKCPVHRQEPALWKWMAEFRYKGDATRYAKAFEGSRIVRDEVI